MTRHYHFAVVTNPHGRHYFAGSDACVLWRYARLILEPGGWAVVW